MCSNCGASHPDEQRFVNEHNQRLEPQGDAAAYVQAIFEGYAVRHKPSLKIETAVDSMNRWHAYQEGTLDGENDIIGTGSSEDEAIENLLEKLGVRV